MNLINELNVKNTEYIIIGGRYDAWGIDPKIRYPYVYKYLNANYDLFNKLGNRTIIKKIKMKKISFWETDVGNKDYKYQKKIFSLNYPNEGEYVKKLEDKVKKFYK